MAHKKGKGDSTVDLLLELPWRGAAIMGTLFFCMALTLMPPLNLFMLVLSGICGLATLAGLTRVANRLSLWSSANTLESVRNMSWRQFEALISEAYKRKGYWVEETGGGGADGGKDLILTKNGKKTLVQCKRWKVFKVGVSVVREMFGVMVADHANHVIIVTSGDFTQEARDFARGKPIELIAGDKLVHMIADIKRVANNAPSAKMPTPTLATSSVAKDLHVHVKTSQTCPRCSSPMVLRTARRGINAGNQFWGCSRYPACKGIVNVW